MSIQSSRVGSASRRRNHMFGLNHKALREEAIVRKREIGRMKNEFWDSTAKYFDRLHTQNERFSLWNSDEMAKKSEEAFRKSKMAETRRSNLLGRRTKLRNKLEAEESRDLENIRKIPVGAQKSLKSVREEYEKMKMKRMEEQQKEAEEKMLQHWRINNPEYRQVQCQKRYEMVQKAWDEQRVEKEKAENAEKRAEEIRIRVEAEKTLRKDSEEKESQREKERQIQAWKEVIVQQIGALKERRSEEEKTKRILAEEQEREKKMEEVAMKRKKFEDKRKMQDLREFLTRQHRLKLLAKTSQVQKDLEEDKRLLEEVTAFSQAQNEQDIKERLEKNQRLTWLKEVIDLQKSEEAKRQKQMEMLFSEEAEKMWHKQEAVWQKEQEARKHLMDDVLDGLKEQIRVKVQEKEREREMVSEERRKIQENIDRLSHDIQKEEEEQEKKKQLFVEDLDHQVAEKKADPTKRNINDKSQRIFLGRKPFVETNELANKLNFQLNLDEPVISDFRRKKMKW